MIGFAKNNSKKALSKQVQILQRKIRLATVLYQRYKNDLFLARLQILHKLLIDQDILDQHQKYAEWVSKLNKLDYHRATRSFFAELKSKNKTSEHFGPIINASGDLSTTLQGCLKNWVSYYTKLYTNSSKDLEYDGQTLINHPKVTGIQLERLNAEITIPEMIYAIDTLKDYSTAGEDMILSRDFTVLLHTWTP